MSLFGQTVQTKRETANAEHSAESFNLTSMDPYTPRTRTGARKKNIGLSQKEYTKVNLEEYVRKTITNLD